MTKSVNAVIRFSNGDDGDTLNLCSECVESVDFKSFKDLIYWMFATTIGIRRKCFGCKKRRMCVDLTDRVLVNK